MELNQRERVLLLLKLIERERGREMGLKLQEVGDGDPMKSRERGGKITTEVCSKKYDPRSEENT